MVTTLLMLSLCWFLSVAGAHRWGINRGERRAYLASRDLLENSLEQAESLRLRWEQTERELQDEKFRHQSRIGTIEGILKEKEVWRRRGEEEAVAHGNAQAMMMGVIEHLHQRLAKEGIDVPLPPVLKQLQEEFVGKHVFPVIGNPGNTIASNLKPPAENPA